MRTIEQTVYNFDELSDEARETAINNFRDNNQEFFWANEINDTLDKFCDIFSINYKQIDYENPYRNDYTINLDGNILELSGLRLSKYIWNNFKTDLFKRKYLKCFDEHKKHKNIVNETSKNTSNKYSFYYSRISFDNCCVLTGVWYDDDILKPIYEFLDKPKNIDFETLLNDCIHSLCHSVQSEIKYQNTDEYIIEQIEANQYEFDECGDMI